MLVLSTPSFNKDIGKLNDYKVARRIEQIITKMKTVDNISEIGGVKKLAGPSNAYHIRIADFRLGFTLSDNTINLIIFAHRKDIYRYFS